MRNVLVINSSPRPHGNSETLADALLRGVSDAGNKGGKINLRQMQVRPCIGCMQCQAGRGSPCVQKDDMDKVYEAIGEADGVVFASPLYWMTFNGIMKNMLDRLFAMSADGIPKRDTALIIPATTNNNEIFSMVIPYFERCVAGVMGWPVKGIIRAGGLAGVGDAEKSSYIEEAYKLGKIM